MGYPYCAGKLSGPSTIVCKKALTAMPSCILERPRPGEHGVLESVQDFMHLY
jgi:hypothetical protein